MSQFNPPSGRVFATAARDFNRELIRATNGGPARPTKTLGGSPGFAPPGSFAASFAAYAEGADSGQDAKSGSADVMPLLGGWSLTTDDNGSLIALHEDGSRQVLAARNVPATGEDEFNG